MKIVCEKEQLVTAVLNCQRAITAKTTFKLFEGINICAVADKLILNSTDREIGIECTIDAMVDQEGTALVDARLFGDLVRKLPSSSVDMNCMDNTKINVKSGDAIFDIYSINGEGFPPFPSVEKKNVYVVDQLLFKRMLQQTYFAISMDESRKTLTGLLVESDGKEMVTVAVDGYRIALRRCNVENQKKEENKEAEKKQDTEENKNAEKNQDIEKNQDTISAAVAEKSEIVSQIKVIIPGKTVNELIKIIPSTTGKLMIYGTKNQIIVEFENCRVHTGIIEGEFFNYKYIVPEQSVTDVIVNTTDFLDAVERASLILNSELVKRYPILLKIEGDVLKVKSASNLGQVDEKIKVDATGKNLEVAFNPKFLIEALKSIEEEKIKISFTSEVGQCLIRPLSGDSFVHLILPVKRAV